MNPALWFVAGFCTSVILALLVSVAFVRYWVQRARIEPGETIVIEGHYCEGDK